MKWDTEDLENDPRLTCRHGTHIDSWWFPDQMCGDCDYDDFSLNEMLELSNEKLFNLRRAEHAVLNFIERLGDYREDIDSSAREALEKCYNLSLEVWETDRMTIYTRNGEKIEQYAHLCDPDLGYDDNSVIRKKHQEDVDKFLLKNNLLN